jgi:hypothetical protein
MRRSNPWLRDAVTDCIDGSVLCKETISYCLEEGAASHAELIVSLLSCSDVCRTTSDFIVIEGDLAAESSQFCAVVCERSAERCDLVPGDEQLQLCAEGLRRIAATCLAVAAQGFSPDGAGP